MKVLIFFVIVLFIALSIAGVVINYDKNTYQDKRLKQLEDQRWNYQDDYYELFNESRDVSIQRDTTHKQIYALLDSFKIQNQEFTQELQALEDKVRNEFVVWLTRINTFLLTELDSLAVMINDNEYDTNLIRTNLEKTKEKLDKTDTLILEMLYGHVNKKRGIFKRPHDEEVKLLIKEYLELRKYLLELEQSM